MVMSHAPLDRIEHTAHLIFMPRFWNSYPSSVVEITRRIHIIDRNLQCCNVLKPASSFSLGDNCAAFKKPAFSLAVETPVFQSPI